MSDYRVKNYIEPDVKYDYGGARAGEYRYTIYLTKKAADSLRKLQIKFDNLHEPLNRLLEEYNHNQGNPFSKW